MCYIKSYEDQLDNYLIEIVNKAKKAYTNIKALSQYDKAIGILDKMNEKKCSKRYGSE